MPTVASGSEMRLAILAAIARGRAHELSDVEAGLVEIDGARHFVLAFTAAGLPEPQVFVTSPVGGVLVAQQLTDLVCSRGGIIAILKDTLDPTASVAASPAFEGAER